MSLSLLARQDLCYIMCRSRVQQSLFAFVSTTLTVTRLGSLKNDDAADNGQLTRQENTVKYFGPDSVFSYWRLSQVTPRTSNSVGKIQ